MMIMEVSTSGGVLWLVRLVHGGKRKKYTCFIALNEFNQMQATTCMHSANPTRRPRRRAPARQLLLEAAARVFARDGLDGATTRSISREAGVNEVTLFRQFGTKEHLIEAVVGRAFGPVRRVTPPDAAPASASLRADLDAFAGSYSAWLQENLPLIRTLIGEVHRHQLCEHQALHGIYRPMRAALVGRLELARERGEIARSSEPAIAADLFAGMIFAGVLKRTRSLSPLEYRADEYRKACVDLFIRGIAPQA